MGRRAKKAPVQTKKRPTLAKRFKCPFCANEEVVECKMDFKNGIGSLACRLCAASYQMPIHHLHEPVDVFSEWLDDCEAAAQGKQTHNQHSGGPGTGNVPRYDSDSEESNSALPPASGLQNKQPAASNKSKESGGGGGASRPSYSDLGLNDSDDDSDDE